MKKIWFHFVRKEPETGVKCTDEAVERSHDPEQDVADSGAGRLDRQDEDGVIGVDLRLTGDLWLLPKGEYYPVVLTGRIETEAESHALHLLPADLHFEVGLSRRLTCRLAGLHTDGWNVMETDRPLVATVERHTGVALVHVYDAPFPEEGAELEVMASSLQRQWQATGSALFRYVRAHGRLYDASFRLWLVELDQFHLAAEEGAWVGRLFQAEAEELEGRRAHSLLRQLRATGTGADLPALLRRLASRSTP